MKRGQRWRLAGVGAAVVAMGALPAQAVTAGAAAGAPHAVFGNPTAITNPWLPMQPGVSFIYDGFIGAHNRAEHDVVTTSHQVKVITGIPSVVQVDTGWISGVLVEVTDDYFAQDSAGNVWYMGEYATQYKNGQPVGHAGSWLAGVNGAAAGIIMEANPQPGDTYRQESYPGQALDSATVLSTVASVTVPFGTWINSALLTKEFSPLEPGQLEHKFYIRGIGNVRTLQVKGLPNEFLDLTGIQYPAPGN